LYQVNGRIGIRVHEKSLKRLKERLKALTSRKRSGSMERILGEITRLVIGWLGYYCIADMRKHLQQLEEWLRRRIRQVFWKRWKRIRTRYENLIHLGTPKPKAWEWANTRKGYWRIAGSWILTGTLTNQYLESIGFPNMGKRYETLHATR
jgi:hypothetical protein